MNKFCITVIRISLTCSVFATHTATADEASPVEKYLLEGKLADGAAAMQTLIEADADDQQARFSLGVVQFCRPSKGSGRITTATASSPGEPVQSLSCDYRFPKTKSRKKFRT